ncbi:MAG: L-2-hydroxyglutarate oxidase [Gemmatimonadales bacterium]
MTQLPVVVVGGGIVGLGTALALAEEHQLRVVVLEAADSLGRHQTGHNSGVIHSGLYYAPGSSKATLCRTGLDRMYRFCEEEAVPHRRTGKLVVATTAAELPRLERLEGLGRANGVPLRRLPAEALGEHEPHVTGLAGLWVESTGIVDFGQVAAAMGRRLGRSGADIRTGARVLGIRADGPGFVVETTNGTVAASQVVSCAGLQSDRVARMTGHAPSVRIVAFRGEYYRLKAERADLVRGLIYPVPDPALPFLGVHFTRGIDGAVEAGPNAVLALGREGYRWSDVSLRDLADWATFGGFWRMAGTHWRTGLDEVRRSWSRARFARSLQALVPEVREEDLAPGGAGVRAQAVRADGGLESDFVFAEGRNVVHVLNAPSPAATASLAIGSHIAARLAATAG